MIGRVVIVGSGASGVHFALTLLKKGYRVLMLDVGHRRPEPVRAEDDFLALKRNLPDPAEYFLGTRYQALILPGHGGEYYGFPPGKEYIFRERRDFDYRARGFAPLVSFAAGGLAEAWTGGCYPFHDGELERFPFGYREIEGGYAEVARRIGITGADDDLSQFFPLHAGLLEPLDLDEHSSILLETYRGKRDQFNGKLGCYLGRSRIAVLSRALGGRQPCSYSGRCLWGCPSDALYTPSLTLRECQQYPDFEYAAGVYASHFHFRDGGRIDKLVVVNTATGVREEVEVSTLVLAAGCLSTSRIFLQSLHEAGGKNLRLGGLMDNRQILMPWINLKMIGRRYEPRSYQYHQLAFGAVGAGPMDYVHGLITTLKTALVHPIVQSLPFDLGSATRVFRDIHAALGLVNINFSDTRREENYLALESAGKGAPRLVIQYRPEAGEPGRLRSASRRFRKILWKLGCIAPPQMTHIRPMGASVHYAGTIPMAARPGSFECTSGCRSFDFQNLYFADGTTFPALPAKNLTFTLMANAVRVAEQEF